jgi:hypothetical protein
MNVISPQLFVLVFTAVGGGLILLIFWVIDAIQRRKDERELGRQLAEPFECEVLYQGTAVADLTDRRFAEMFWHDYRIEPRTPESRRLIDNDDLWEQCDFYFREPKSGDLCTMGFSRGPRPFVRGGRVWLRGMYFGGKSFRATEAQKLEITNCDLQFDARNDPLPLDE